MTRNNQTHAARDNGPNLQKDTAVNLADKFHIDTERAAPSFTGYWENPLLPPPPGERMIPVNFTVTGNNTPADPVNPIVALTTQDGVIVPLNVTVTGDAVATMEPIGPLAIYPIGTDSYVEPDGQDHQIKQAPAITTADPSAITLERMIKMAAIFQDQQRYLPDDPPHPFACGKSRFGNNQDNAMFEQALLQLRVAALRDAQSRDSPLPHDLSEGENIGPDLTGLLQQMTALALPIGSSITLLQQQMEYPVPLNG